MIQYLLLLACACALDVADNAPPYIQSSDNVLEAIETLQLCVISMIADYPSLKDSRRHYAEIIHVINYEALRQSGCVRFPYDEEYQKNLNISAPEAIANPDLVIAEVTELIDDIEKNINEIENLKHMCIKYIDDHCDALIDREVKAHPEIYAHQADVLLAAGKAAAELNANNRVFLAVSDKLSAHQFVILGAKELENIVAAFADLHRVLSPLRAC